jgi:hypothetical protein
MRSRRCFFRRSTIARVDVYEVAFSGETPILDASPRGSAVGEKEHIEVSEQETDRDSEQVALACHRDGGRPSCAERREESTEQGRKQHGQFFVTQVP